MFSNKSLTLPSPVPGGARAANPRFTGGISCAYTEGAMNDPFPSPNGLSSDQARFVLENALDAVVGVNGANRVIDWNLQAEQIFGWSKAEALGQEISDLLIPPAMRDAHRHGLKRFIGTGQSTILNRRIELTAVDKAGRNFPVELTVIPFRVGEEHFFYSFLRDITERKRTEDALKEALRAKDDFIGICSHELKTPVTSLKLQFQLAARQIKQGDGKAYEPGTIERRVAMANSQLDRMGKLIEDMLAATQLARGPLRLQPEPLDLVALAQEVFERFADQFAVEDIPVNFAPGPAEIPLLADRFRLEQVLSNLFTNAIKYGEGKEVTIRLGAEKKVARFEVADHGQGIAPENLERIFHAFERTESATNVTGLGLGLYISRQLAEAHGGRLYAESELGEGSRFVLELPRLLT